MYDDPNTQEQRVTWDVTPECPVGACSFSVVSSTGNKGIRYKFDPGLGDYRQKFSYTEDCVDAATREVQVADAYSVDSVDDLKVKEAVISDEDDVAYATRMAGTETETVQLTPEGANAGCTPQGTNARILAIRIDKPSGKPALPDGSPIEEGVVGE